MEQSILFEKSAGVATIYLNEPESLNALSASIKEGLFNTLMACEQDDTVKVIILTGKGRAFCAGGDIKTMGAANTAVQMKKRMDSTAKLVQLIHQISKPIISAVHGYAFGAGFSIALASDIIVSEKGTKFGLAFKNLGAIPDCGAHYFLSKAVGPWKAKEWIWTGATITAEEGERYGFVNQLVEQGDTYTKSKELALELSNGPVHAFGFAKSIVNRSFNLDLGEVLELEGFGQAIAFQTKDHQEGVQAFREKRTPQFIGE